jgi:hypothetical protein
MCKELKLKLETKIIDCKEIILEEPWIVEDCAIIEDVTGRSEEEIEADQINDVYKNLHSQIENMQQIKAEVGIIRGEKEFKIIFSDKLKRKIMQVEIF